MGAKKGLSKENLGKSPSELDMIRFLAEGYRKKVNKTMKIKVIKRDFGEPLSGFASST